MPQLKEITAYLNQLLAIDKLVDYCPNGLQVEGRSDVKKIVTGVTASKALLDAAITEKADLILVHHGYFWQGEDSCIVGLKRERLQTLLSQNMSLLAYHLPLDLHPIYGNNVQLAKKLDISSFAPLGNQGDLRFVWTGRLSKPMTGEDLAAHIEISLARKPLHIAGKNQLIDTVAWSTGAAQKMINLALEAGVDAYISGEISESTVHITRESQLHYFASGHHATERYGIKALGEHVKQIFSLEHQFIDIDNPV